MSTRVLSLDRDVQLQNWMPLPISFGKGSHGATGEGYLGSKMDCERKNAANISDSTMWRLILILMP